MAPLVRIWNKLGDSVSLGVRHFQNARHISHGVFCHHFTKSRNICYAIKTVFFGTILNHFISARILNIDIDIWHRNTIRIQKSLKKKVVFERIEIRNVERVRNNRTGRRTTAWAKDNPLRFTPVNKVLNDEKIPIITHSIKNTELHIDAINLLFRKFLSNFWN